MMLDADVVAASSSTVYRVLSEAGVLDRFNGKASKKGTRQWAAIHLTRL
jgi:hypothetical protein